MESFTDVTVTMTKPANSALLTILPIQSMDSKLKAISDQNKFSYIGIDVKEKINAAAL